MVRIKTLKIKNLLVVLFIIITIIFNHFNGIINHLYPNMLSSNSKPVLEDKRTQTIQKNMLNYKINNLTEETIQYFVEQCERFELKANESREILSPSETNISIRSRVLNSSFQLLSTGNNSIDDWKNDAEYGDVNVSTILSGNETVFRLNFSNKSVFDSGVNNSKFLVSSHPNLENYSTIISFDFQIPSLSQELQTSSHTLSLDFRFNNGKISFILSDKGGTLHGDGFEEFEDDIIYDNRSNSIYILCNETTPFSWRHISYNITRLITTYLLPQDYPNFSNLQSLFCHMIAYIPYNLTLDINNLKYWAYLPPYPSINYTIGETEIFTENGTLSFDSIMDNSTLAAQENSSWKNNTITHIEVNLTRKKSFESYCILKEWNETNVRVNMELDIPDIIENAFSSNIHIILPSDWINITILNEKVEFVYLNQTKMLNEYILGKFYQINVKGMSWGILEAWTPNYLSNIIAPTDVCRNEVILIRGQLHYPLSEDINLYLKNESFCFHQTTLPMINSTFIFPEITVTEQFPLGILQLTLNWTNSWEFGIYQQIIYIYEQASSQSIILFHSSQNVDIYQFESVIVNISLLQNGERYSTNSTIVLLLKGSDCLFFTRVSNNNYILNVSHVIWDPGIYNIDLIASDGSFFYAKALLNLTIKPASIFWSFENLPATLAQNESLSFRLYSYINPHGENDYYIILSGLVIRIWINGSVIASFKTNYEGLVDITVDYNCFTTENDYLQVAIDGVLNGDIFKLQTFIFHISNETYPNSGFRAYISEIMRSPIKSNKTFFIYYRIEYSTNNSSWFVPFESFSDVILSAFIIRDSYIIGTEFEDELLTWTIEANQSNNDILVLELPGPTILIVKETLAKKFRLKLLINSQITTNNYSIDINLDFLGFPFSNLSLFDSLNRNVTELFPITIKGAIVSFYNFNIISGFEICYFLEGYLQELDIILIKPFNPSYIYNESIIGSWRINSPVEFSYKVICSILGLGSWECYDTSLDVLSNSTSVITVFLPPQSWNSTISIQLIVKYFSDLILVSSSQNFTIKDPFPPTLDYSVVLKDGLVRIDAYIFEPEKASGIQNVTILTKDQTILPTSLSPNHFMFNISKNIIHTFVIKAIDWAKNEKSTELVDVNDIFPNSPTLLDTIGTRYFLPLISSITLLTGIFVIRLIKKKRSMII